MVLKKIARYIRAIYRSGWDYYSHNRMDLAALIISLVALVVACMGLAITWMYTISS